MKTPRTRMITITTAVLLLCGALPPPAAAQDTPAEYGAKRLFIHLGAAGLFSADPDFRDVYGSIAVMPEIKIGATILGPLHIWAGYGVFSQRGTVPVIETEAKATQQFLSFGCGLGGRLSGRTFFRLDAGIVGIRFSEEAFGTDVTEGAQGARLDAALNFVLSESLALEAAAGYLYGSDNISSMTINLGGLKAGLGLTYRF